MWITSFMTKNNRNVNPAVKGCVTDTSATTVELSGSSRHKDVPVVAPWGVVSVPPVGSEAVAVNTHSGIALVGVKQKAAENLEPGEVMLCSQGASIVLKNDGRVLVNGKELGGV